MDYIEIKGYKSIKDLHLDLKPINVLIGANGAGKSNFISFFRMLSALYNQQLQGYVANNGGLNKFLFNGRKTTESIEFHLSFNSNGNGYSLLLTAADKKFTVSSEKLWLKENDWEIGSYKEEADVKNSSIYGARYILEYLNGLRVYHFHDTGKKSPFNDDAKLADATRLAGDGANIAAFLYALRELHPIIYRRIIGIVQAIAPYFNDFRLEPNMGGEYIRLAWMDKYSDTYYDVSDFSDGTIRFIALATLFLQPNPPQTIIIDEPELGLHPLAISKLAGLVKSAAAKGTQVILSTQSTDLVSCFDPEDIVVADRKDGASTFERLNSDALSVWLEDYLLGDIWKRNIINKGFPNK